MTSANSDDRHKSQPLLQRRLGSELRRLREEAGLTTEHAAGQLYCSASKISRLEKGRVRATFRDVRDLLELYEVSPQQRMEVHQLAVEARRRDAWWHSCSDVPDVRTFMGFERAASSIRAFESLYISGLLQVEGYAKIITHALLPHLSAHRVARLVQLRMERQRLLKGADPPVLQVVLDEATIRRLTGMPDVMHEQLTRLRSAARMPNVTVQVLPFIAGARAGLNGSFTMLGFPHEADRDVVFFELPTGQLYLDGEEDLHQYLRLFESLQAAALSTEESIAFFEELEPP